MIALRKCQHCGIEFLTRNPWAAKWCSKKCNMRAWRRANPEKMKFQDEKRKLRKKIQCQPLSS